MKRRTMHRLIKLGSIASTGMMFQAAGCTALDVDALANTLVTTFSTLFINSLVGGLFGVGF